MDFGGVVREEAVAFPTTQLRAGPSISLRLLNVSHKGHSSSRVLVALLDQMTQEVCQCRMNMGEEPDTLYVDGGLYKIVTTISPSKNTQVYVDEQLYLENHGIHFGAFIINLPTVKPEDDYLVEFSLFKRQAASLSDEDQYVKCLELFYWPKEHHTTGSVQHLLSKIKFSGLLQRSFPWKIITYFEDLSDNGYSNRFQRDRERLEGYVRGSSGYEELLAFVLLTECDALLLCHEIDEAIQLAEKACRISSNYNGPSNLFIQGYAKVAFAARHRFRGDFEAADDELAGAFEIFQQLEPSEYSCALYYNMAACFMAKSAAGIEVNAGTAEEAVLLSLEHWECQTQIKTNRRPQRIHNRKLSFLLKSSPGKAPDLQNVVVPAENLQRVRYGLAMFEGALLDGCPPWPKTLFFLNKTDYFIWTRNVEEGFRANYQSLIIAQRHGFKREIQGARERTCCLETIRRQLGRPVSEIESGEGSQQPSGPPEDYDFMQELMPLTEHHRLQLPVEELQNPGERLPEQHPHSRGEDNELVEATGLTAVHHRSLNSTRSFPGEPRTVEGRVRSQMCVTEIWSGDRSPQEHPADLPEYYESREDLEPARLSW